MDTDIIKKWMAKGETVVPNVLLEHYQDLNMTSEEALIVVRLKGMLDKGETFPSVKRIAKEMHTSTDDVYQILHHLTKKQILSIEQKKDNVGKTFDVISLDLLWEKLFYTLKKKEVNQKNKTEKVTEKELIESFEREFSRPLSPMELETIGFWLDDDSYSMELINLALREAVLNQAYNFRYIDRILRNWEKKNITTKEQVQKESQAFRNKQTKVSTEDETIKKQVPIYNWLDDEE